MTTPVALGWQVFNAVVRPSPPSRVLRTGTWFWLCDRTLSTGDGRNCWNANYGGANEALVISRHKALLDAILIWLTGANAGLNILLNALTPDGGSRPFDGAVETYLTTTLGNTVTRTGTGSLHEVDVSPYDLICEQYDPGNVQSMIARDAAVAAGKPLFSPNNYYNGGGLQDYGCDDGGNQTWSEPPTYPDYQRSFDWLGTPYWCTTVNGRKLAPYTPQGKPGATALYEDSIGQDVLFTWEST